MKPTIVRALCLSAPFIVGMAAAVSAQDHRTCSNASLAGAWGYTETGTVVTPAGPVSAAAVGRYTFDREGTFSGTQHSSVAGTISQDTKLGTYTVNPDCTATLTLEIYSPSGALLRRSIWEIVLVDDEAEFHGIMTSLVLPNNVPLAPIMTMSAKRVSPRDGNDEENEH